MLRLLRKSDTQPMCLLAITVGSRNLFVVGPQRKGNIDVQRYKLGQKNDDFSYTFSIFRKDLNSFWKNSKKYFCSVCVTEVDKPQILCNSLHMYVRSGDINNANALHMFPGKEGQLFTGFVVFKAFHLLNRKD